MPASVEFIDTDKGVGGIIAEIEKEGGYVDIGVQADESEELLIIAGAHEFGATIKHPGGTSFGYRTEKEAKAGKVRFLKKGKGFMELGKTKAHVINIPARPYIRATIDGNEELFLRHADTLADEILDGNMTKHEALTEIGQLIEGETKKYMINLRSPANAPSTIKKKGSDNPLIDTGLLVGSIRYAVSKGEA